MDELFDILDEDGNSTGEVQQRSRVHVNGLWHKVIHVYVYRKTGNTIELLTHLRAKTKDLYPDMWDIRFGGHVLAGSTLEETVVKEMQEEIGLTISLENVTRGITRKSGKFPNNEFATSFFYNFTDEEKTLSFNDGEVQAVKWRSIQEISEEMTAHSQSWVTGPERVIEVSKIIKKLL